MTKTAQAKVTEMIDILVRTERYNQINRCCKLVLTKAEYETDQNIKALLYAVYQDLEALHDPA